MKIVQWLKARLLGEVYDEIEALRDEIEDQKPAIRAAVFVVRDEYNKAVSQQDEKIRAIEKCIEAEHGQRVRSARAQSEAAKKAVEEGMVRARYAVANDVTNAVERHCKMLDKRLDDAIKGLHQQFDNLAADEASRK